MGKIGHIQFMQFQGVRINYSARGSLLDFDKVKQAHNRGKSSSIRHVDKNSTITVNYSLTTPLSFILLEFQPSTGIAIAMCIDIFYGRPLRVLG